MWSLLYIYQFFFFSSSFSTKSLPLFPFRFSKHLVFKNSILLSFFDSFKSIKFFFTLFRLNFIKTKFFYSYIHLKGIGFKLYKSHISNSLVINSGYNHYTKIFYPSFINLIVRKFYVLLYSNSHQHNYYVNTLRHIRYPDPYRAKGFRFKNQLIKLKIGKQRLVSLNLILMIKLFGKHLPINFRIGRTLKSFYGISFKRSNFYCRKLGISYNKFYRQIPSPNKFFFSKIFAPSAKLNPFIQRSYARNLNFKIRNGSYHGFCLVNNLPSRGQRSKTNGKTAFRGLIKSFLQKFS